MNVGVVINQHAAGGRDDVVVKNIRTAFAQQGIDAAVRLSPSHRLAATANELIAQKAEALVAGGCDGTVSTIAEICAGHHLPLGLLPLGTRNHFGRYLGIPRCTSESVRCIANGKTCKVDLGSVNDRLFINNSSIGA